MKIVGVTCHLMVAVHPCVVHSRLVGTNMTKTCSSSLQQCTNLTKKHRTKVQQDRFTYQMSNNCLKVNHDE